MAALAQFDEVIHSPRRLAACAFLAVVDRAEFPVVRDALGVSDSVLSKHISVLVQEGYVELDKGADNKRPRTWLRLTLAGRRAYAGHVRALREMLQDTPEDL